MPTESPPGLSDEQFDALVSVGHDVLCAFPRKAGACVMMSALYTGRLRHLGHTSAILVGGALLVTGSPVFGYAPGGGRLKTDLDWDGHAWVRFGEYIADVSLVTTAYSPGAPKLLASHIAPRMKPTQRLYIATPDAARRDDQLDYQPQRVFTDADLDRLYRGALTFLT
jgi:hypothetical protein